jgi:hypothetical protein
MLKKGQGGVNAAVLVAVIAGLIVLYILFLPENEREALLENKSISKTSSGSTVDDEDLILRKFPGRLDTVEGVIDKSIPNIFLFEKTEAKELVKLNPIIVRNGWFDKKIREVRFSIADLENTENLVLAFNAKKHDGILTIKLNNQIIFENDLVTETSPPIRLDKNLMESSNSFEFSVSSVGFGFWNTNEYSIEDLRIIGDITDRSKQESRNVFTLSDRELFNVEKAELRFVPYCRSESKVGVLDVLVNNRNIFSAVPVCEDPYRQSVPLGILNEGENRVIFRTNKGSYSVEQIQMEFVEKDVIEKVYFFEINNSIIKKVESGNNDIVLTIEFTEDVKSKRADIIINDRRINVDTEKKLYSKTLNRDKDLDYLEEGNNFIEIRPRTRLDIKELRVEMQDN